MEKKTIFKNAAWIVAITCSMALLSFIVLPQKDILKHDRNEAMHRDTIPGEYEFNTKDLDHTMKNIDNEFKKSLQELNKIDWSTIQKQVNDAVANIDVAKMQLKTKKAVQHIDMVAMQKQIQEAIKKLNTQEGNINMSAAIDAVKKIDQQKIIKEVELSLKNIDFSKIKSDVEQAQKNLEHTKIQMDFNKDKITEAVNKSLQKVKLQLRNFKEAANEMEKDGLINKEKNNNIQYKGGSLYINGEKQPDNISEKYKGYFYENKEEPLDDAGIIV